MRTCWRCNTSKEPATRKTPPKKTASRWPSIWGQAADVPFSKSSTQWKTLLDVQFGERSRGGDRAILRFWWPIRRRPAARWDGPPSAIWLTSSRVRGYGRRKTRRAKKRSLWKAQASEQVDIAGVRAKGLERIFGLDVFHASRALRVTFFQPLEGVVAVSHYGVVSGYLVGCAVPPLRLVLQYLD